MVAWLLVMLYTFTSTIYYKTEVTIQIPSIYYLMVPYIACYNVLVRTIIVYQINIVLYLFGHEFPSCYC